MSSSLTTRKKLFFALLATLLAVALLEMGAYIWLAFLTPSVGELATTSEQDRLVQTKDPRALGLAAPWDYYPYYGLRRNKNWQVDKKP